MERFLIENLKYSGITECLSQIRTSLLSSYPDTNAFENFLIVPIPLHRKRLTERGFNQSSLIAKLISREYRNCSFCDLLIRNRDTIKQSLLSKEERKENVRQAFSVSSNSGILSGSKILLVDDIITTGSTMRECARILKEAGAAIIYAFAFASDK